MKSSLRVADHYLFTTTKNFCEAGKIDYRGGHQNHLGLKVMVNQIFTEAVQTPALVNQIKNKKRKPHGQAHRAHPRTHRAHPQAAANASAPSSSPVDLVTLALDPPPRGATALDP
jgi:hypothetical protein